MDFDVLILGCGPAGLQAGIHAARKKVKVGIVGHPDRSAINKAHVENYFGVEGKVDGEKLLATGIQQAEKFGAKIVRSDVVGSGKDGELFVLTTEDDEVLKAKSLIMAMGVSRAKLNVEGEKEFLGKGVSYCTACDCGFFRGKKVAIVGNESTAASSAMLMTEYASAVYWVTNETKVAGPLMEKLKKTSVRIIASWPAKIVGNEVVQGLVLADGSRLEVDGVFIELGAKGAIDLAFDLGVVPQPDGSIKVNEKMETEAPGLFACGDVTGEPWQLARAVGQGCIAGNNAAKFVKKEAY